MNISAKILKLFGWTVDYTVPDYSKCIICVAPHTSNWDFILGELAVRSVGRKAGFLMKSSWFFFPLGYFFKSIGGIPVNRRKKSGSLVGSIVEQFNTMKKLSIAITPEGTRKRVTNWHTGFLYIAYEAKVPIVLGAIDAENKQIIVRETFQPTGNVEADLLAIKRYYRNFVGIKPYNFTTD
ncbi:MAG: acyltransferase [Bacteroidales bacterium]|nr:acyltransferase [Bacteroidales bacterium]